MGSRDGRPPPYLPPPITHHPTSTSHRPPPTTQPPTSHLPGASGSAPFTYLRFPTCYFLLPPGASGSAPFTSLTPVLPTSYFLLPTSTRCVGVGSLYFTCIWWAAGMLMGAPISMTAPQGPFAPHYSLARGDHTMLNIAEVQAWMGVESQSMCMHAHTAPVHACPLHAHMCMFTTHVHEMFTHVHVHHTCACSPHMCMFDGKGGRVSSYCSQRHSQLNLPLTLTITLTL